MGLGQVEVETEFLPSSGMRSLEDSILTSNFVDDWDSIRIFFYYYLVESRLKYLIKNSISASEFTPSRGSLNRQSLLETLIKIPRKTEFLTASEQKRWDY